MTTNVTTTQAVADESPAAITSRVVVAVDGSEHSKRALRWGAHLAALEGAAIEAVIVWEPPITWGYGWTPMSGSWDPWANAEKALTETVDEVFGAHRPADLTLQVVEGYPAQRLMDIAEGATFLVVGSRGRGTFANVTLGSVSMKCSEHATCPVLVVHNTEPPSSVACVVRADPYAVVASETGPA